MRNNFHLKFKEWKDRKKYSQKSFEGYCSKSQNSPPPAGAIQKELRNEDFREEKKIAKEQKQKEMEEKKNKKKGAKKQGT